MHNTHFSAPSTAARWSLWQIQPSFCDGGGIGSRKNDCRTLILVA
jgi:hypothetical protein